MLQRQPLTDMEVRAVGGWLKEDDARMNRSYRRLVDMDRALMNPGHLAYFEDYLVRYFNDRLVSGQGVEEILAALGTHGGAPGRWIDLGAGVTTLFWAIGVNAPQSVFVCDLVPEALQVLLDFKNGSVLPPCYEEALSLSGRLWRDFETVRRMDWTFHVFDCLAPWGIPNEDRGFDLITAVGCFGLASDAEGYRAAFSAAAANMSAGSRIVGADWIRSSMFVDEEGHDNRYLSAQLTERCANALGLHLLEATRVSITGDPYYDAVIVWAFAKRD